MKFIQKTVWLATTLFGAQMAQSQFFVGGSVGIYSTVDNVSITEKQAAGYNFKAGYVKKLYKNLGIGIGVELAQYNHNLIGENDISASTYLVDETNSAFEYRVNTSGYQEKQVLTAFQIPVFVQYKKLINVGTHFYARAGAKYMLPLSFKTTATATRVAASGYYPDFNLLVTDLPSHGFGVTNGYNQKGSYNTENIFLGSLEIGFSFKIAKKSTIYTGFFYDQALQSIIKNDSNNSFIGYNPSATTSRPLNGIYSANTNIEVKPRNFGVSLSYSFE
jgi:hypothetical protein